MEYKDQRKLFHMSAENADAVYQQRIGSKDAIKIDFVVAGSPAFCLMDSEVYRLILQAERLDKQINGLVQELPGKAIDQYLTNCLIDEIVLTNEIEGVNSTRREIGEVLERLEKNDRRGRFHGIVEKYLALQKGGPVPLGTCADVRRIYDELVLDEVLAQNENDAPDGVLFRSGPVDVLDAAQRPIHHGLEPESRIIEAIETGLALLNDERVETLVRIALFHFLFAYAHPFYDGNGRTNRFISSSVLSREFSPLVGLRLSYAIKEEIGSYYKGFSLCEHPLNKGDLTPFVILFSEIIVKAMESMEASLSEKKAALDDALGRIGNIVGIADGGKALAKDRFCLANVLAQAALFAESGISSGEISQVMEVSMPTVYQRLKFFEERGLLAKKRVGRGVFYSLNLDELAR